jgi:FKBP-type peptidyl-prolyl cis-trans isomerase FkpA
MNKILSLLFLVGLFFVAGCSKDPVVLSPADQLTKDIQLIDDYLASKNITAVKDPSGLRYVVTREGTGAKPALYSNVNVSYDGKFLESGQSFDRSSKPLTIYLYTGIIKGWQIGLPLVNKGSKVTLYIPSGLAYGASGTTSGSIPANTNISFDIELLDDAAQLAKDVAAIDKYLDSLKITAVKDPSGLRYSVAAVGSGSKPTLTSTVYFTYSSTLFKKDASIGQATSIVSAYVGTIVPVGLQIGFQQISKGSTATFYIPSSLGLGLNTSSDGTTIPANSNLVYTIQFVDSN